MKIRNVSRFGALDVPLLGRVVDAGEVVDVTSDQAERLLAQPDNFEKVTTTTTTSGGAGGNKQGEGA